MNVLKAGYGLMCLGLVVAIIAGYSIAQTHGSNTLTRHERILAKANASQALSGDDIRFEQEYGYQGMLNTLYGGTAGLFLLGGAVLVYVGRNKRTATLM